MSPPLGGCRCSIAYFAIAVVAMMLGAHIHAVANGDPTIRHVRGPSQPGVGLGIYRRAP
jgi:hypothetical protein